MTNLGADRTRYVSHSDLWLFDRAPHELGGLLRRQFLLVPLTLDDRADLERKHGARAGTNTRRVGV